MEFQGIRSRVYIRFLETLDFGARIFNEFQRFWRTEFSRFLFLFTTAIWMQVMHQTKEPQLPIMHAFLRHGYDWHAHQRVSKYSYSLQTWLCHMHTPGIIFFNHVGQEMERTRLQLLRGSGTKLPDSVSVTKAAGTWVARLWGQSSHEVCM